MKKVYITNLGCKVNQYESQAMRKAFRNRGWEISDVADGVDACVVNSCSVTSIADRKSRQVVRQCRAKNPKAVTVLTGCYAQTGTKAVKQMPEVDLVIGTNRKNTIPEAVEACLEKKLAHAGVIGESEYRKADVLPYDEIEGFEEMGPVVAMEGRTRAYIKIQEGCNRFCSYCIIPYARGKVRSRSTEAIIDEAKRLIDGGYKEIVLTGINTALYGAEGDGQSKIHEIIKALNDLEGEFRIRLSSLEPTVINAEYIKSLFKFDKLCHHVHLSLQSGSDKVLKDMNRLYTREEYLDIVKEIVDFDRNYGITTDIIAGFPGESEKDFKSSLSICEEVDFCKVHGFKYSARSGTPAAEAEQDKSLRVSGEIKQLRVTELAKASQTSADRFIQNNLGTKREVLFEEVVKNAKGLFATGLADNYIRVYLPVKRKSEGECLINRLEMAVLKEPLLDGILCSLL